METEVIHIKDENDLAEATGVAASLLHSGEAVAFPTETVYGLGADALNPEAVAKIFAAKNRPADNPLIVHLTDQSQLDGLVSDIPPIARTLMSAFWPGQLSLVLPKKATVPDITTGGLGTVVVRCPQHPTARTLLERFGGPIAAPSANLSGKVSPTRAAHVLEDMQGRIPLILEDDAGVTGGLESTVVDCTTEPLTILRPGSVTEEMLREYAPDITVAQSNSPQRSPGMKYQHYAPTAPVTLFLGEETATAEAIARQVAKHKPGTVVCIWHTGDFPTNTHSIRLPVSTGAAASVIFAALRRADQLHPQHIFIQGYPTMGVGTAIMNRLQKAATTTISC